MSQSPLEADAKSQSYHDGWGAMSRFLRRGFSWSGNERDVAFSNRGGGRFADVSTPAGLDLLQDGRAAARIDWDFDGDLDLVVTARTSPRVRVLRNDQESGNGWWMARLEGPARVGARVELTLESGDVLVRALRVGEGFLAQSTEWLHFGLREKLSSDEVTVRWADGSEEVFAGVRSGRYQVLKQGAGQARPWTPPSVAPPAEPGEPVDLAGPRRVVLRTPLPLPVMNLSTGYGESPRSVRLFGLDPGGYGKGTGQPVLMTVFSRTCAPCAREMAALAQESEGIRAAGLDLVAITVDPTSEGPEIRAFLERSGYPGTEGRASAATLALLDAIHSSLLDTDEHLPVPTSFLIDHEGRLQVMYVGELEPERVLRDLNLVRFTGRQREQAGLPFPGRYLTNERTPVIQQLGWFEQVLKRRGLLGAAGEVSVARIDARQVDEAKIQREFGVARLRQDNLDAALVHFLEATRLDPANAEGWSALGYVLHRLEDLEAAREAYTRAIRFAPEDARARVNLGLVQHALGNHVEVEATRKWLRDRGSELLPAFEARVDG